MWMIAWLTLVLLVGMDEGMLILSLALVRTDKGDRPMLFRELSSEEELSFRQWADENYVPFSEINGVWHPVIQARCAEINKECGEKVDVEKAMQALLNGDG
jgi:hypothetical protein